MGRSCSSIDLGIIDRSRRGVVGRVAALAIARFAFVVFVVRVFDAGNLPRLGIYEFYFSALLLVRGELVDPDSYSNFFGSPSITPSSTFPYRVSRVSNT